MNGSIYTYIYVWRRWGSLGGDSGGVVKLDVAIGIFEQNHQKFLLVDREKQGTI